MMTSDKDFAQLVSENIFMYRPGNKWAPTEVWGIKEVLEKFQIQKVSQVIDYLGMMGDRRQYSWTSWSREEDYKNL